MTNFSDTHSPSVTVAEDAAQARPPMEVPHVGEGAQSVVLRRVRYVVRFAYWAIKHRSTSNAAWVCATEGLWW